jgi:hypothetical protein
MRGMKGTTGHAPKQELGGGKAARFRGAFLMEFGLRIEERAFSHMDRLAEEGEYWEVVRFCRGRPRFVQYGIERIQWEMEKAYRAAMDGKGPRPGRMGVVLEFIALNAEDLSLGAWAVRELVEDGEMNRVGKVAEKAAEWKVRKYAGERLQAHGC